MHDEKIGPASDLHELLHSHASKTENYARPQPGKKSRSFDLCFC